MRCSRLVILALFACWMAAGAVPHGAQAPPSATKPSAQVKPSVAERPIERLGWFVGGTWTAEEKTDDGGTLLVKLTCTWADTKQAILYKVLFESRGKETPQYDGMYVWNPEKKSFNLWQVNREGEVAEGSLTVNGEEMDQDVRVVHPDGSLHFLKAHYTRVNNDAFHFKAWFRLSESAEWQYALDIIYKRQPASAAPR